MGNTTSVQVQTSSVTLQNTCSNFPVMYTISPSVLNGTGTIPASGSAVVNLPPATSYNYTITSSADQSTIGSGRFVLTSGTNTSLIITCSGVSVSQVPAPTPQPSGGSSSALWWIIIIIIIIPIIAWLLSRNKSAKGSVVPGYGAPAGGIPVVGY